jgi:hypothetical protein
LDKETMAEMDTTPHHTQAVAVAVQVMLVEVEH